ncbi:MAG: PQQ-binding-like beta-propeller repeat protein [Planctomycetes bacterium]|jgi:outer membrane protein assembly factor BamB|nr:PQQ-binding-like beta-propeller repeat protein [Planctomycetota bacterium]
MCFVPILAGTVYALNTRNGRTEWSYHAPGYFAGMMMLVEETSMLSLMGDFLAVTHRGASAAWTFWRGVPRGCCTACGTPPAGCLARD